MTTSIWGYIKRIITRQSKSIKLAHGELITMSCEQAIKMVILEISRSSLAQQSASQPKEQIWWKSQKAKWETLLCMIKEATADTSNKRLLSNLRGISTTAFTLYEAMVIQAAVDITEIPSHMLRAEAIRWREVGIIISSLHRHCLLAELRGAEERKNGDFSGITILKD